MLDIKPFRQKPSFCGPACLKMVLRYYGTDKTEKELGKLTKCTFDKGTPGINILKAAHKLGFDGFIKDNATIKKLREYVEKKKIPVIVDWFSVSEGHYSVVIGIDKENIYIQDPEFGSMRALRLKEFKNEWFDFSGNLLKPTDQIVIRRMIVIFKKKKL